MAERILVVDDEPHILELCRRALTKQGYEVDTALNAEEALKLADGKKFDVVLLDIRMPGMDGLTLAQKIKETHPDIVTVFMTGYADLNMAIKAVEEGAHGFVTKPFGVDEIVNAVRQAIEKHKLVAETIRLEQLMRLFEVTKTITSTVDLDQLLKVILDSALQETKASSGSIMLLDEEKGELVVKAVKGTPEEFLGKRVKVGEGISGLVAASLTPILVEDIETDPRFSHLRHGRGEGRSFLSIPIVFKEKLYGVINVSKGRPDEKFSEADLRLLNILAGQGAVAIENARLYQELQNAYISTILALASAMEAKDPYTRGHSERVADFSRKIALEMGLPQKQADDLHRAGLMHDIGKIGIPDLILQKPSPLTREEMAIVKLHPLIGKQILSPAKFLEPLIPAVYHHHERFDGKGYLEGLRDGSIPLEARIMAAADAFEAMTSDRPYRKALKVEEALEELKRGKGTQFDPDVVDAFLRAMEKERKR